ncbi:MAG: hypothetical protein K6A98_04585 [Prevotella sp.]|nr:hypothetical protein [Prevotella sp.]
MRTRLMFIFISVALSLNAQESDSLVNSKQRNSAVDDEKSLSDHAVQTDAQVDPLMRDYNYVMGADAWLTGGNAASLTRFRSNNIAVAGLSLSTRRGGLTHYHDSREVTQLTAATEALCRLGQRVVVSGYMSYDNYSGKDMTGSAFINPLRKPFDITEETTENSGKKHRDTYHINGAVGVDVFRGYAIGASLDYTAANYAKYKDLRHKNKLMDMDFSAGVYLPVLKYLSIGADYHYLRNTESVSFSTYGKSDKVYRSLINYGAFFGIMEQFGNEGFTDKSREMPLFEDGHAGDIQASLRLGSRLSLWGRGGIARSKGYYGRRSPYTAVYTRHKRHTDDMAFAMLYSPENGRSRHRVDFSYRNERLNNKAETFREMINSSGAYYYEYYDAVETADKQWQDMRLAYTASLGVKGELPTWLLDVAWQWGRQEQLNYLYPFYRHQDISYNVLSAGVTRNIICKRGVWSLSFDIAFRDGSGKPYEDHTYVTPSDKQERPSTSDEFLYREYQYLAAAQYHLGGGVRYSFIFPGTNIKTHAGVSVSHDKANETFAGCSGRDRTVCMVSVGCTF